VVRQRPHFAAEGDEVGDFIDCGPDDDWAFVDSTDKVAENCETVEVE